MPKINVVFFLLFLKFGLPDNVHAHILLSGEHDRSIGRLSILQSDTTLLGISSKELKSKIPYQDLRIDSLTAKFSELVSQHTASFFQKLKEEKKNALTRGSLKFNLSAENNYGVQQQDARSKTERTLNQAGVKGGIEIAGFPVSLEYSNNYYRTGNLRYRDNLFRVNFDKEVFSGFSKGRLPANSLKVNLRVPDISSEIKKSVAATLGSLYRNRNISQFSSIMEYINDPANALELLDMDEAALRKLLQSKLTKPAVLKNTTTGTTLKSKSVAETSRRRIDTIVHTVSALKKELKKAAWTIQKIRSVEKYLANEDLNFSDLSMLGELIEGNGKSRYSDSFLSKINMLKLGSFGNNISSSMADQDILMRGGHIAVHTRRGPVVLGYGTNEDVGLTKDAGMQSSVYSSPQKLAYLSIGTNNSAYLKGKFTWINSISAGQLNERFNVSSLPRNTVGLTINQSVNLNKMGKLNVDLSKSANVYRNALEPGAERILEHRNFFNDYLFDSSFQTLAVGISHQGEIAPWNLSNNFYMNYSGLGYQNPVVTGISPVRFKLGGNLKKRFFNNKVSLNLRTDLRNTPMNSGTDDKWKNYQFQLDSRFRISRKFNFSLKYSENGMAKQLSGVNTTIYSSTKFQVSGNANYKLWKLQNSSNLNIAYQNLSNSQLLTMPGNFMNANYSHSMIMGQSSLSANVFYNKEMSAYELIGDLINGEISYQYPFLDELNLSTAINYLENDQIIKQYGVRQSLQVLSAKNFDFNASADIRKNLIAPVYPELYPACQVELSLKYYLNK